MGLGYLIRNKQQGNHSEVSYKEDTNVRDGKSLNGAGDDDVSFKGKASDDNTIPWWYIGP